MYSPVEVLQKGFTMKIKLMGLLATLFLVSGAASAQTEGTNLKRWAGEIVGHDKTTNIVTLYQREKGMSYKVWVQRSTEVLRDGQRRGLTANDLLMGDLVKVDGILLDDGRIVGAGVHYPEPVGTAPANRLTMFPQAGTRLNTTRPTIGANFAGQLDPATVRVFVDGQEVTKMTAVNTQSVTYSPQADLPAGGHQVHLIARDNYGDVNRVWSFDTLAAAPPAPVAPPPLSLQLTSPSNNGQVAKSFSIMGTTRPGATVDLQLTPNQKVLGGFLGLKGNTSQSTTTADAAGNFRFNIQSPYKSGTSLDIGITARDGQEATQTSHYTVTQK